MKNTKPANVVAINTLLDIDGVRVGRIAEINDNGQVLVDFPGNVQGLIEARLTSSAIDKLRLTKPLGKAVLLAFENSDPTLPIIVDTLYSLLDDVTEETGVAIDVEKTDEVVVDGKRITFDAEEEIVLKCGKASITLTKAGKVIIRGDYLLSRSSGLNRIKGGSVQIN
jgi:molybdopterin-binding protein